MLAEPHLTIDDLVRDAKAEAQDMIALLEPMERSGELAFAAGGFIGKDGKFSPELQHRIDNGLMHLKFALNKARSALRESAPELVLLYNDESKSYYSDGRLLLLSYRIKERTQKAGGKKRAQQQHDNDPLAQWIAKYQERISGVTDRSKRLKIRRNIINEMEAKTHKYPSDKTIQRRFPTK
jgi:hypothetical protein